MSTMRDLFEAEENFKEVIDLLARLFIGDDLSFSLDTQIEKILELNSERYREWLKAESELEGD